MAAPPNPLASMMAQRAIASMAGGGGPQQGAPPGGPGGPGGGSPPSPAGAQIQQQLSELQGADPQSMLKVLQQVKSILVGIYPRSAFSIPDVSRNVAQAMKYIDNAIKAAEQAAMTAQTVQPAIANSTGINNPDQGLQQFSEGA